MGTSIVLRDDQAVPYSRRVNKALVRVEERSVVRRAQIATQEGEAAYRVALRLQNGHALAEHAVDRTVKLDAYITARTRGRPGLEVSLREVEAHYIEAAGHLVTADYMLR